MPSPKDLTGLKFGRLTAVKRTALRRSNSIVWECVCECGTWKNLPASTLVAGTTQSCGCLRLDRLREAYQDKHEDLTGRKFARLTAVAYVGKKHGHRIWKFRCDCGNYHDTSAHSAKNGLTKSCGCFNRESILERQLVDRTGVRYGKLVVLKIHDRKYKKVRWECRCDCGNLTITTSTALTSGQTASCGCLRREATRIHGLWLEPEYRRFLVRKRRALKKGNGGSHTIAEIKKLFSLQRGRCAYCKINISLEKKNGYHADHIIPICNGGTSDIYNIQLLCPPCNTQKNRRDPLDFARRRGMLF